MVEMCCPKKDASPCSRLLQTLPQGDSEDPRPHSVYEAGVSEHYPYPEITIRGLYAWEAHSPPHESSLQKNNCISTEGRISILFLTMRAIIAITE
jgi:hypothetical protein